MKDRRLRMLWNSNGFWVPSGYGVEQQYLLTRFAEEGWATAQIAFSGLEGAPIQLNKIRVYPKMGDTWGSDGMVYHARHFQANAVFTMQDIWTLNPQFLQSLIQDGRPWIPYLPIDQEPVPPNVLANLKLANRIITFSKFGRKALQKEGFVSTLIPEGTDVNVFKPYDKIESRKLFNIPPDAFVVGMVGANKENPPRKGWQQALEAFKLFHDNHPNSYFFYQTNQNSGTGFPIGQFAQYLGLEKNVLFMDPYMATFHAYGEAMAKLYSSFDILSHASLTEGFGLCVVEAQACGVPVIVNNCHSMPELVVEGVTGEICDWDFKFFTSSLGFYHFPSIKSLHEKMEKLFKSDLKKMGEEARKHVVENYNVDTIFKEKWIPYIESLQMELLGIDKSKEKV